MSLDEENSHIFGTVGVNRGMIGMYRSGDVISVVVSICVDTRYLGVGLMAEVAWGFNLTIYPL